MKTRLFVFILFLVIISSCKKEEEKPEEENPLFDPAIATAVTAKCKISEVGGSGFILVTAHDEMSPISNGSFQTVVSKEGAQLLFMRDNNNKIRALTLSLPYSSSANIIDIGANSTAVSLIFLTPGILTSDKTEAALNIQKIKELSKFNEFETYIRNNLKNKSIEEIVKDDAYISLLEGCINDYVWTNRKKNVSIVTESKNFFEVNYDGNKTIDLVNKGFRFVNVVQMDMNNSQSEIKTKTVLSSMKGNVPFSWGSIFTSTLFEPGKDNVEYISEKNTSYTHMWIIGPGDFINKPYDVPGSIDKIENPWIETVAYYVVFPLIDLLTGSLSMAEMTDESFRQAILEMKTYRNIPPLAEAKDNIAFKRALVDMSVIIINAAAGAAAAVTTGVLGAISAVAAKVVALSSVIFSTANLTAFIMSVNNYDCYSVFLIEPSNGIPFVPVLKTPSNNLSEIPIPVTFSWNSSYNAKNYQLQISQTADFTQVDIWENNIAALEKQISNLQKGIHYFWRVQAINGTEQSGWSEIRNFSTEKEKGKSPVADFSGTPTTITQGQSVFFTDKSVNNATSWLWTFGDGSTSTEQNPTHTYNSSGTYTVSLKAANSYGSNTKTITNYIVVAEAGSPTFTIGQNYGGGIIFYVDGSGKHGLIAAKTDQSESIEWYNGSFKYVGATDRSIGVGQANTLKIINTLGQGNYAASICDNLVLEGYNDWFLPSYDELREMFGHADVLKINTIDYYWSSTDSGCTSGAWGGGCAYYMNYAFISSQGVGFKHRVRAIRKF